MLHFLSKKSLKKHRRGLKHRGLVQCVSSLPPSAYAATTTMATTVVSSTPASPQVTSLGQVS